MVIQKKTLRNVLFVDIETVPQTHSFHELSETTQGLWMQKCKQFISDRSITPTIEIAAELYQQKAGIFAEFGKVICISIGYLSKVKEAQSKLRIKSIYGDEADLLSTFTDILDLHYDDLENHYLCGHNIKEFDIPYLCRRNLIHGLPLPRMLRIAGKKPWQLNHLLDTMELWRFGDYKNYTSLALLAGALQIPSPKDDIDGSQVAEVYWTDNDLQRIVTYCEKDVITVAQIVMRFSYLPLIHEEDIEIVKEEKVI